MSANTTVTPDEADAAAERLQQAAREIRRDAARALCEQAGGHQWDGWNAYAHLGGPKIRREWCLRVDCDTERTLDGWQGEGSAVREFSRVLYDQAVRGGAGHEEAMRIATDPDADWPVR